MSGQKPYPYKDSVTYDLNGKMRESYLTIKVYIYTLLHKKRLELLNTLRKYY